MTEKAAVFTEILKDYLGQVSRIGEKEETAESLGITWRDDKYIIPYFQQPYTVASDCIVDSAGNAANHTVAVILCKYLLLHSNVPSGDFSLITYKDFRDATPYVGGFRSTVEQPIANYFSNRVSDLEKGCKNLGGENFETEVSCQLAISLQALPKVPIYLIFHDADEDFPAQATILFQKNASSFLDMECLAMLGASLAHRLQQN